MTAARYLLRFDDLCPTMSWGIWNEVEAALRERNIRPILAVIPDNADPSFHYERPADDFWERVRGWQADGWAIGLHGYRHLYVSDQSGLCGTDARSEFAGVNRAEQERKLRAAIGVFDEHGVTAEAWIAPNHSFDETTVDLVASLGIPVINDGFALRPHADDHGMLWVPCQLNGYRPKRSGVWTIHFHTNYWDDGDLATFLAGLDEIGDRITDLAAVRAGYCDRPWSLTDTLYARYRLGRRRVRRLSGPPPMPTTASDANRAGAGTNHLDRAGT